MSEDRQRLVGSVNPTARSDSLNQDSSLLPKEISVVTACVGIRAGTEKEFRQVKGVYEQKVSELADKQVEMVHVGGAPPMMVHGFTGEGEFVEMLEEKYKTPVYTAGRSQSNAFRALGMKSFVGLTYFPDSLNKIFADYFTQAGFEVLVMEGLDVPFEAVPQVPKEEIGSFAKAAFQKHAGAADGIYMLGSGWNVMELAPDLETELHVPVVHAQAAKIWNILKHFQMHRPIAGYGRLLQELP